MRMNENLIVICTLLIMLVVGGFFIHGSYMERLERSQTDHRREVRSTRDIRALLLQRQTCVESGRHCSNVVHLQTSRCQLIRSQVCRHQFTLSVRGRLFSCKEAGDLLPSHESLNRKRRGFRSYFYNYLDELAMAICGSIPTEGPGLVYAVRRTCSETEELSCKQICTDQKLREQAPKEVQKLTWTCSESLHVYKRQPSLADNYEEYSDSYKLGLAVYRHHSCKVAKCGPNYCCCRATATAM